MKKKIAMKFKRSRVYARSFHREEAVRSLENDFEANEIVFLFSLFFTFVDIFKLSYHRVFWLFLQAMAILLNLKKKNLFSQN